jgi:CDP-glucose 4,6-dehydratase
MTGQVTKRLSMKNTFNSEYEGRRVLVTGHSGFKGSWLTLWLKELGASVYGFGLKPETEPNFYTLVREPVLAGEVISDIRDPQEVEKALREIRPDLIFHLAAQPLVRRSYTHPVDTFAINALGTAHLLDAVRRLRLPAAVVVVTSDKCYRNQEWDHGYREGDPLGGHDVYSMSKAAAELVTESWRRSFFDGDAQLGPVASARAGNVIGGGDYAEDRLVPDCVRSLLEGRPIVIRNPAATRPWQHVLDCLSGYLWLGAQLLTKGKDRSIATAFNFGPDNEANVSVRTIVEQILQIWPGRWEYPGARPAVHEAGRLHLSTDRAAAVLQWFPTWNRARAVEQTIEWYYQRHVRRGDMVSFSRGQIQAFAEEAARKGRRWALARAERTATDLQPTLASGVAQ